MTHRVFFTLWLTGLPGAGKSTLARAVRDVLVRGGHRIEILDGDEVRKAVSADLGYSRRDRAQHVARVGFIANLLSRNGTGVIVAAIAPYRDGRAEVRRQHEAPFVEVFVDCAIDELVRRDPKGLYAKALVGDLARFTGISDPYEPPVMPDLHLRTDQQTVAESTALILTALRNRAFLDLKDGSPPPP